MNMLPFAEEIERLGFAEQGKTLFINYFPAKVKSGVMIRERLIGASLNHEMPGYIKFSFQVIVRSASYQAGEELAVGIAKSLNLKNQDLAQYQIKYCRPANVPVPYPLSDGELTEFNTAFDVCCVDSTWV